MEDHCIGAQAVGLAGTRGWRDRSSAVVTAGRAEA